MAYDTKCGELAEHFLPSDAPETKELAQVIQDAIEDFLGVAEYEPDERGPDRDEWKHEAAAQQRLK
jgi:hypothetical protein